MAPPTTDKPKRGRGRPRKVKPVLNLRPEVRPPTPPPLVARSTEPPKKLPKRKFKKKGRPKGTYSPSDPRDRSKATKKKKISSYRDGAEGMIAWCERFIHVPIYPEGSDVALWIRMDQMPDTLNPKTDKSYLTMWEEQKKILRRALRMHNGRFVYRLIVLCWMRGEGKSLLACMVQLWKFFNWPRQQIMLGANSRDQVKFVHFDIMRDIILNSPDLLTMVGRRNIQEKEIRLKDRFGDIRSIVRSISSFSGIVSNITGYTFSEIFDMKNPKFFSQLDGSIRNIPNAFGVIDSTVSSKTHVLYNLYSGFVTGKTKGVFFSYRCSKTADPADYWNPNMDENQLRDYEQKMPFGDFERYFKNEWEAGQRSVFTEEMIEEVKYVGIDGEVLSHLTLKEALEAKNHLVQVTKDMLEKGLETGVVESEEKVQQIYARLTPMQDFYSLIDQYGSPTMASMPDLERLSEMFDTDWIIGCGTDFGDPFAVRGLARTIDVVVAKGLPGSRSNPYLEIKANATPKYLYIILSVHNSVDHSTDAVKKVMDAADEEYDGIDVLCSERYGAWDMQSWCEEKDSLFDPIYPTYDRQKACFKEVLIATQEGRLKCPPLAVAGSKKEDIREEEMAAFHHDVDKKWFGSMEKWEKRGVQDDFMYALGWAIYGLRLKGVDDFRIRRREKSFGFFVPNRGLVGDYTNA